MKNIDFQSSDKPEHLAEEVSCLKALLTYMLKAMGQADAGKVIIKMEKSIAAMEESEQAKIFTDTLKQIKDGYRQ